MDISRDIKSISYLKSKAADLLKHINKTHRPVIITQNGEPKAVLQDPKSFQDMRNAIGILKILFLAENEIRTNHSVSNEEVMKIIENKLG